MKNMTKGFCKAVIILVVLFSVIYYFGYQKWLEKDFDNDDYSIYIEELPKENEDSNDNQTIIENSIDQSYAKRLYEMINFKMIQENFGKEFFNIYYGSEYTSSFSNEFIIYLGVVNLYKNDFISNCYGSFEIPLDDVDKKIREIFGNDIEYVNTTFESKDKSLVIQYDETRSVYIVTNYRCSGIEFGVGHIKTEFIEGTLKNDCLEITEYVYYIDYYEEDMGRYVLRFYDSLDNSGKLISEDVLNDNDKINMPVYKLIFKKENDYYVFKDIKRVK